MSIHPRTLTLGPNDAAIVFTSRGDGFAVSVILEEAHEREQTFPLPKESCSYMALLCSTPLQESDHPITEVLRAMMENILDSTGGINFSPNVSPASPLN